MGYVIAVNIGLTEDMDVESIVEDIKIKIESVTDNYEVVDYQVIDGRLCIELSNNAELLMIEDLLSADVLNERLFREPIFFDIEALRSFVHKDDKAIDFQRCDIVTYIMLHYSQQLINNLVYKQILDKFIMETQKAVKQ